MTVHGCLSLDVSLVIGCWPVQGVPHFSPNDSLDMLPRPLRQTVMIMDELGQEDGLKPKGSP